MRNLDGEPCLDSCDCTYGYHVIGSCACPTGCWVGLEEAQDIAEERERMQDEDIYELKSRIGDLRAGLRDIAALTPGPDVAAMCRWHRECVALAKETLEKDNERYEARKGA